MAGRVTVTGGNGDDFLQMLDDEVDALGFNLEAECKLTAPVDTGQYRGGFHWNSVRKELVNNVEYAAAVNDLHPTAAHHVEAAIDRVVRR